MRTLINRNNAKVNQMVYVTYIRSYRPGDINHYIAPIQNTKDKFGYILFGHGYDVDKKQMVCGGFGLELDKDFIELETISQEEFNNWVNEYKQFHNDVVKEKGYDFCEEKVETLFF